jgi:HD-GYP domain-containing protein (c-di-GMP phosphodiesterase class II)
MTLNTEIAARQIIESGVAMAMKLHDDVRLCRPIYVDELHPFIEQTYRFILENENALVSLRAIRSAEAGSSMHSVSVAVLMIALARNIGLSQKQICDAGLAGFLHDVGKAHVSQEILNKPGKLTESEFGAIKRHTTLGFRALQDNSTVPLEIAIVCKYHHEKMDGSGYPDGLPGGDIPLLCRMAAVCDVYDALTSDRSYKSSWSPAQAIEAMASWRGHFDPAIFAAFVGTIKVYPTESVDFSAAW